MRNVSLFHVMTNDNVKWTEMFEDEQDLVDSMKRIDMNRYKRLYKGYAFIEGFQKRLDKGEELTPKQMTQLKRLAKYVYQYHAEITNR